ncbi:hypothetical protein DFH09DRAFT_1505223 [Mycena vulgaris]|nr:hypothetical protein DFH09DRAFT_1505223 [Mycena vulgaris]
MSTPPNPASSPSLRTQAKGSRVFKSKSSSQSKSDWLAASLTTAKLIAAGAECIPFPYVKGVFGTVVVILETVEKVKRNRDDLKELCGNIVEIIKIIQDQLVAHGDTGALKFKGLCEDLASVLEGVLQSIKQLSSEARGLSGRFKEVMKLGSTADKIAGYRMRIQELRSNFMSIQLMAAIDTNLQVHRAFSTGRLLDSSAAIVTPTITKCPPPSRIFHGRQNILDKMQKFFEQDLDKQHIYLLHGLGGAGKTQIGLKFIEELSARFSDIFLIDTSTTETIDTGLKNIAATQNAGSTAQDGLSWLSSNLAEWLLFFDNADDPKIDLNNFFPGCKHGNILITSRNPSLRVYAGGHSLVSDMEEPDAVDLLLTSAAQAITPGNKEIAAEIVKALYHLPLAIIQAGAFISESGALDGYLALYVENQDQLLSEKPAQSHDAYAWTVYTTWNLSFQKLTQPAATILQLCSFLHHNGISEEIFSRASVYNFVFQGPSNEELQEPLEFLSQFLGPKNTWDSLQFLKVMNEIKAYSLANFDPDGKLYSIHPLVHSWSKSTLADQDQYHDWMIAIVGMSISGIPDQDIQLASLKLLPHVDSLLHGNTNIRPDFRRRLKDAEQLYLAVFEHRTSVLGEDHPGTLNVMGGLAITYTNLGKLQEAEELGLVVLEKQREILREDHPNTLHAMRNLAITYHQLGKFQEAEELYFVALENWRKISGEDHPETLGIMGNLALTYAKLGKLQEAEELGVVVLEKRRKILGEDHLETLRAMGNLASTYGQLGKLQEAEELVVVMLEKRRKILGEDHLETLHAMGNLANKYAKLGKFQEAEELNIVVLEKQKRILGEDHLETLHTMANLASTYTELGKLQEAEELKVVVLEKRRQILGEDHPDILRAMGNLASTCSQLGKLQDAEELEFVVLEKRRKILGEDHPDTLHAMGNLPSTYHRLGKLQEAEELGVVVVKKRRKILGEDHLGTLNAIGWLAATCYNLNKFKEAEQFYVELLDRRTALCGTHHPDTLCAANDLSITRQAMDDNSPDHS